MSLVAIAKAVGLALENFGGKEGGSLLETPKGDETNRSFSLYITRLFELFAWSNAKHNRVSLLSFPFQDED